MMIRCPRCTSPNVVSNRFEGHYIEKATQAAQAVQAMGIPRLSVLAALGLGAMRGVNALRKEYECTDCNHKFDG